MPRALVTGITGQDGSYLAEFLLEKGYEVVGMVRRTSTVTFDRIAHIQDRIILEQADLLDEVSLIHLLRANRPDEVYNLAAQSFVPTSWRQPVFTGEATALGVTRILDAVRIVDPNIRFYQASSSEMFGKVQEVPQRESTPFYPRSPYGVAKMYGHWITVNYRESYGMFAASGILFNHECIAESTPLLVRHHNEVNIERGRDLVPLRRDGPSVQQFDTRGLDVWDGERWTAVSTVTATRRNATNADHSMIRITCRDGTVDATAHHRMVLSAPEGQSREALTTTGASVVRRPITVVPAGRVAIGDHLRVSDGWPAPTAWTVIEPDMAEMMGWMTEIGTRGPAGELGLKEAPANSLLRVEVLWERLFGGALPPGGRASAVQHARRHSARAPDAEAWLADQLFTDDTEPRVPPLILNATGELQDLYLRGYEAARRESEGRPPENATETRITETTSAVLAQGLLWLYGLRGWAVDVELTDNADHNDRTRYVLLGRLETVVAAEAPTLREVSRGERHAPGSPVATTVRGEPGSGNPTADDADARRVTRAQPMTSPPDWVIDLETESGVFMAGVGRVVVHNSPRRGLEFVTHKVTDAVARIELGLSDELRLGNLEARRDWGWAPDYVRAMWLMLQTEQPDDFVIATGRTHSVAELCDVAFRHVGRDWRNHVVQDDTYMRPAEVDLLVGDATKARTELGWEPQVAFEDMIGRMVDADLAAHAGRRPPG